MKKTIPVVLTIAGSDSGGGAGIQADLKTFSALGTFGATAITAITSQNLQGVGSIQAVRPEIVRDQIRAVCDGFEVAAVKTGMLFSSDIIKIVAEQMKSYGIANLVIDPVFAATSGSKLIEDEAIETIQNELFPLARVITPNMPEAGFLIGKEIDDSAHMKEALRILMDRFPNSTFVIKGGHLKYTALDLYGGGGIEPGELKSEIIAGINNHGSGCSFASAIAAFIAKGTDIEEALKLAKNFITGALKNGLYITDDIGLINHFWQEEKGIH